MAITPGENCGCTIDFVEKEHGVRRHSAPQGDNKDLGNTFLARNGIEARANFASTIRPGRDIAGLLAAVFLVAGTSKLLIPQEKLATAPGGGWVLDFSAGFVKTLGAVEILSAVGLILPALLGIAPILVALAAVGLALDMAGAAIVESRRHEFKHALGNLVYLSLAAFVAWGRFW